MRNLAPISSPVTYHSGTNDRLVVPQMLEHNLNLINTNFVQLEERTQNLEHALVGLKTDHSKLASFMTWLAEQHPNVLDEFSNTVDVAKKLDGTKEPA